MKRKALRVRSEGSMHPYVTEAEPRKQHSDSPLCNSLNGGGTELSLGAFAREGGNYRYDERSYPSRRVAPLVRCG